ncbi:MAG: HEAT repeat domain-containing protein [Polyangiaceae bacterium]
MTSSPDVARDALVEGLGRMKGAAAGAELGRLASGVIDDRRKVAEALANHPERADNLKRLARDPDPGVRANAAWSLGTAGKRDAVPLLSPMLHDPDIAVAGNAAAALGRVSVRERDASAAAALCAALADGRPYVRANALVALGAMGAACDAHPPRDALARDPSESVRVAAADWLGKSIARSKGAASDADRRALLRCTTEDKSATVADACVAALSPRAAGAEKPRSDVQVFVVPDGKNAPTPRAPFALVRADGFLRLGVADRRGAVLELAVPDGTLRLAVPAALAR